MSWIPVTKRMPEIIPQYPYSANVLISTDEGVVVGYMAYDGLWYDDRSRQRGDVRAWQPLPEPYGAQQ